MSKNTLYAVIELFGHNNLGACAIDEVQRFGAMFCEARPIGRDGKPGEPQLIAGSSIYRLRPIDEERAVRMATEGLWSIPALPPLAEEHEGQGDLIDAEWGPTDTAQARGEEDSNEGKGPLTDEELAKMAAELNFSLPENIEDFIAAYRRGYGPTLDDQIAAVRREVEHLASEKKMARSEVRYDHVDEQLTNRLQDLDELLCQKMDVIGEKNAAAGTPKRTHEQLLADHGWNYELGAEFLAAYDAAYERKKVEMNPAGDGAVDTREAAASAVF